jgi:hypothetical protein
MFDFFFIRVEVSPRAQKTGIQPALRKRLDSGSGEQFIVMYTYTHTFISTPDFLGGSAYLMEHGCPVFTRFRFNDRNQLSASQSSFLEDSMVPRSRCSCWKWTSYKHGCQRPIPEDCCPSQHLENM